MPVLSTTITPCLWFDDQLQAAARFYTRIFPDSSMGDLDGPDPVVTGEFTIAGTTFRGINGGPMFRFTEAVSFSIACADQAEVDHYWDALSEGGEESRCGWLKDRFGLSWQVVPTRLGELLGDPDPARAQAAMAAMITMNRIVVADLEAAADAAQP